MTNYEWLIKTKQLGIFLIDVVTAFKSCSMEHYYGWENKRYKGLNFKPYESEKANFTDCLESWLQAEHKETKKYVPIEDVQGVIQWASEAGFVSYLNGQRILDRICLLKNAKEIEE